MSENLTTSATLPTGWGTDLAAVMCEHCQCSYLIPCNFTPLQCPNCWSVVEILPNGQAELTHPYPPELILPFELSHQKLVEAVREFSAGIPFAPHGLHSAALLSGLVEIYLPMWLVDSSVSAIWQAEAGFDYQVISHQEFYVQNQGWKSREVKEPRVHWEQRVGRLNRVYQNIATPALDDAIRLEKRLGAFNLKSALSYSPERIRKAYIRMPDRLPQTAWNEAAAAFQKIAADDCQRACSAAHNRQFRWKAQFYRPNWTLMLLPIYSTRYIDDQGESHTILIHGQTGGISGPRRASTRRAGWMGLLILFAGVLLFLAGLLVDASAAPNTVMAVVSTYIIVLGIAGILAAAAPFLIAWDFNRRQKMEEHQTR